MAVADNSTPVILYATDFSDSSHRALICVKHMARLRGLTVRSVHVLDLAGADGHFEKLQDSAHKDLRRVRRELRLAGIKEIPSMITAGAPAPAICSAARRYGAGILVIGVSGDNFVISSVMGTTARSILRNAPCPVMTVGIRSEDPPSHKFDRVLYVADTDPYALPKALCAWPIRNRLEAPYFVVLPPGEDPDGEDPQGVERIPSRAAVRYLLHQAKELNADLVVLAVRTGSYLDSFTTGTLAYRIIARAPCPVLTVRL